MTDPGQKTGLHGLRPGKFNLYQSNISDYKDPWNTGFLSVVCLINIYNNGNFLILTHLHCNEWRYLLLLILISKMIGNSSRYLFKKKKYLRHNFLETCWYLNMIHQILLAHIFNVFKVILSWKPLIDLL